MCTAMGCKQKDYYFGRTLDHDTSYGETVTVVPRGYPFRFEGESQRHYAMIGMTAGEPLSGDYPLFYDGANEKGLCMAGLNFVGNAVYTKPSEDRWNPAVYELIPWILGSCASVKEARAALRGISVTAKPFRTPQGEEVPAALLHWIIGDKEEAITVESTADGLHVYDNPVGVLTNNPPFPMQMFSLNDYRNLSRRDGGNRFSENLPLEEYSRGMGAIGLPGDFSSRSRFVRTSFLKLNAVWEETEGACVGQFFRILGSVEVPRGCCILEDGTEERTVYTSCINGDRGIYYYTTYGNRQVTAVDLHGVDLDSDSLVRYELVTEQQILRCN